MHVNEAAFKAEIVDDELVINGHGTGDLAQLSSQSQVDQELAKLKAEVGSGSEKKEIEQ